jgi:heme-degrading monooxygenase HmoA
MITIIWEYQVKPDYLAEFETLYAPCGKWGQLFRKGKGFLGTRLIRSPEDRHRFVTIDQWESLRDYKTFLALCKEEYETLDRECEGLTERESCLGTYGAGFADSQ